MPRTGAPGAAGILLAASLTLTACVTPPTLAPLAPPPTDTGDAIAALAVSLVGSPYQFGGADAAGFDCSGLARYVHEQVGVAIPRTAREQQRAARPVAPDELAPGDLIFFHIHSGNVDHVGIYTGAGRFIHAPRAGSAVAYGELRSGYYRRHFSSAGRFWESASRVSPP
jgi:cell wall-associated NlpC family hydrolase